MNNYILNIEITDDELALIKSFKNENYRHRINGYNPIAWSLEYKGILISTYLNEKGIKTKDLQFLLSGIGKQLYNNLGV